MNEEGGSGRKEQRTGHDSDEFRLVNMEFAEPTLLDVADEAAREGGTSDAFALERFKESPLSALY